MLRLRVVAVFVLAVAVLYAVPGIVEFAIVRHLGPWVSCVVLGNLFGCAILFHWGLRRTAIGIYVAAGSLEACLLETHAVSPTSLIWLTNLIPAMIVAVLIALICTPDGAFE